jgi:hypothetical protein
VKRQTLQAAIHRCHRCQEPFEALHLPEPIPYGTFLLRSESGAHLAVLDATSDSLFSEIVKALKAEPGDGDPRRRPDIVQRVYGEVCDQAPDASPFVVEGPPPCPRCGDRVSSWSMIDKYVEVDIPSATHSDWDRMGAGEKRARLGRVMAAAIS